MELNREQIINGLGRFHQRILDSNLAEQIYYEEMMALIDAIALIKELVKENERIKADTIRNMRTHIFNKAVYPDGTREHAYITLKVFDSILAEMLERKNNSQ